MAKQSKAQKDTIDRVMHEFKEGQLETNGGQVVKSRRQAIAIALSEAGASNQQSPAENKKRLSRTKAREGKTGQSKAELYQEAKRRNLPGRSAMNKAELARALA